MIRKRERYYFPLPGDNQASRVSSMLATMPKADGLKMCFLLNRKIYLDATVKKQRVNSYTSDCFNNKHKLIALIGRSIPRKFHPGLPKGKGNFSA